MTKLEQIKAECRKAIELGKSGTLGPWGTEETCATSWVGPMRTNGDGKVATIVCGLPINNELKPEYSARNLADSRSIAHARTFSPAAAKALLVAIEALEKPRVPKDCPFCTDKEPCGTCYTLATEDGCRIHLLEQICQNWPDPVQEQV